MEETKGEYKDLEIHPEALEYWKNGKLPEHFRYAQEYYQMQLKDDNWYRDNEGMYVAIMAKNPVEAEVKVHKDLDELLKIAYKEWGYRPIFTAQVSKEKVVSTIRPRFKSL